MNKNKDEFKFREKNGRIAYSMVEHIDKTEKKLRDDHERLIKNAIFGGTPKKRPSPFFDLWKNPFGTAGEWRNWKKTKGCKPEHKPELGAYDQEHMGEFPIQWEEWDLGDVTWDFSVDPPAPDKGSNFRRPQSVTYSQFKKRILENMEPQQAIFQYGLRMDDTSLEHYIDVAITHFYTRAPYRIFDPFKRRLKDELNEAFAWVFNGSGYKMTYSQFRDAIFKEYPALAHNEDRFPVNPVMRKQLLDGSRTRFAQELSDAEFKLYRDRLDQEIDEKERSDWEKLRKLSSRGYLSNETLKEHTLRDRVVTKDFGKQAGKTVSMGCEIKKEICSICGETSCRHLDERPMLNVEKDMELAERLITQGLGVPKSLLSAPYTKIAEEDTLGNLEVCINCGKIRHEHTVDHLCTSPKFHSQLKTVRRIDDSLDSTRSYKVSDGTSETFKIKKTKVDAEAINKVFVENIETAENANSKVGVYNPRGLGNLEIYSEGDEIEVEREVLDEPEVCDICGSMTGCMCPRPKEVVQVRRDVKGPKSFIVNQMYEGIKFARGVAIIIGDQELSDMLIKPLKHVEKRLEKKVK